MRCSFAAALMGLAHRLLAISSSQSCFRHKRKRAGEVIDYLGIGVGRCAVCVVFVFCVSWNTQYVIPSRCLPLVTIASPDRRTTSSYGCMPTSQRGVAHSVTPILAFGSARIDGARGFTELCNAHSCWHGAFKAHVTYVTSNCRGVFPQPPPLDREREGRAAARDAKFARLAQPPPMCTHMHTRMRVCTRVMCMHVEPHHVAYVLACRIPYACKQL